MNRVTDDSCTNSQTFGWTCDDPTQTQSWTELADVVHDGRSGGVLCCRD